MQKIIIQNYYLKSELKTYISNNFSYTSNNPIVYDAIRIAIGLLDNAVQITFNNHRQQYNNFFYTINNVAIQFDDDSSIFGTYSIKTKDTNFTPGTKTIFPITSSTGKFLGFSGFIIIDVEDDKRFITIVLN